MIGTVLDKYEVLQKVGEGGMATVYRGRHTTLNREVAVKVLHPHLSSSTRNRKRFAREARAIEQLRHENILKIFDYSGAAAEDCYIVTEFVGGKTLTDWTQEMGLLPSEIVSMIGLHLANALSYAHTSGVLHRDLKPDNVMIRNDGAVKLMDFGIARFLDETQVTMTGALVGSPAFMSPEQAKEGKLDARSDLFSLGTVLFYLSTGHFPFHGSNPSLVLKNIIEGNRPHVSDLTPDLSATLVDVIERLLQVDPNDRHTHAHDVAEALQCSLTEVGLDDNDSQKTIAQYLQQPEAWTQSSETHLRVVLLERGKDHLSRGEHLSALRLFNRLLTLDEENAEVMRLVKGLHSSPRKRPYAGIGAALFLCLLLAAGAFALWWQETRTRDVVENVPGTSESITPEGPAREVSSPPPSFSTELPPAVIQDKPPPKANTTPKVLPEPSKPTRAVVVMAETPTNPPVVTPPVAKEEGTGRLDLRVNNGWGYIFVDGVSTGRTTRDPRSLELPAGGHEVEIRSPLIKTKKMKVFVSPGEVQRHGSIEVEYLPIKFSADERFPGDCKLKLDGKEKGTLAENAHKLTIPRKLGSSSIITILCGDDYFQTTVNESTSLETHFPYPSSPAP